jgi:hypothetical protein
VWFYSHPAPVKNSRTEDFGIPDVLPRSVLDAPPLFPFQSPTTLSVPSCPPVGKWAGLALMLAHAIIEDTMNNNFLLCIILVLLGGCNARNVPDTNGIPPDEIEKKNEYRSSVWKHGQRWMSIADQYPIGPNFGLKVIRLDRGGSISLRIVNNEISTIECYRLNDFTFNWDNAKRIVSVFDIIDEKYGIIIKINDGHLVVVEWANQSLKPSP